MLAQSRERFLVQKCDPDYFVKLTVGEGPPYQHVAQIFQTRTTHRDGGETSTAAISCRTRNDNPFTFSEIVSEELCPQEVPNA